MLRDQARAQQRAQKAAFRAQRDAYRAQNRVPRRSSILGPLLVLSIGIVALLVSLGKLPMLTLATWYARWWPLVIVAAGLLLVAEWSFDQLAAHDGTPYVRRGIGGGAITLLILLTIVGLTSRSVHNNQDFFTNALSINPDNIDQVFGQKFDREQQIDQAFAAGVTLALTNPHGDITIAGASTDGQIHLTINKQLYSSSEGDANSKAERLSPSVVQTGNTLSVTLPKLDGASADVTVSLPEAAQVTVNADRGDIRISGMRAAVNVTSNSGDVELNNIAGGVTAHLNSSNSTFAAHTVSGDLTLRGRADDVSVTDISGQASLEGEFYGDTHLERLLGPIAFRTSRTTLTLAKLPGAIDISPDSELSGDNLAGPTLLRTRSRNISLQHVAGSVDVTNSNGSVDVSNGLPLGAVTISNHDGSVNLTLPDHAGVSVHAQDRDGSIENDLALQPVSRGDFSELQGAVGDGATSVNLQTSHADITIHKQLVVASPQEPPAAPALPAKRDKLKQHSSSPKASAPPATQTF